MKAYTQVALIPEKIEESWNKWKEVKESNMEGISNRISILKKCFIHTVEQCAKKLVEVQHVCYVLWKSQARNKHYYETNEIK